MNETNYNPWGERKNKDPCNLTLRIKCESQGDRQKIRALIIGLVFKEYGIKQTNYKFFLEEDKKIR